MTISVLRYNDTGDATLGLFLIDGKFYGYTLEDEFRHVAAGEKVMHETRIPEGNYKIELRTFGGHHEKYSHRYDFHKGMLQIMDVPGFTDILIHTGNTDEHTSGCVLVGDLPTSRETIGHSVKCYSEIYPVILEAIERNEPVNIQVTRVYYEKEKI